MPTAGHRAESCAGTRSNVPVTARSCQGHVQSGRPMFSQFRQSALGQNVNAFCTWPKLCQTKCIHLLLQGLLHKLWSASFLFGRRSKAGVGESAGVRMTRPCTLTQGGPVHTLFSSSSKNFVLRFFHGQHGALCGPRNLPMWPSVPASRVPVGARL